MSPSQALVPQLPSPTGRSYAAQWRQGPRADCRMYPVLNIYSMACAHTTRRGSH